MTRNKFFKRKRQIIRVDLSKMYFQMTLLWIVTLYRVCKFCADLLPVKIWKYYFVRCELPAQITWGNVPLSNTTTTNRAARLARERRDQPPWNTTTHSLAVGRCGGHDPKETQQRGRSITWDIGATTTNHTAWLWLITLNHHHHPAT